MYICDVILCIQFLHKKLKSNVRKKFNFIQDELYIVNPSEYLDLLSRDISIKSIDRANRYDDGL